MAPWTKFQFDSSNIIKTCFTHFHKINRKWFFVFQYKWFDWQTKISNWISINLHLSNIQSCIENTTVWVDYAKFNWLLKLRAIFGTNLKANPFDVEWCVQHSECNSMQKCCNCTMWIIWIPHNIRILIEHNTNYSHSNPMLPIQRISKV